MTFPQKIYFIHIPKTAGTFVTTTLQAALGDRFVREHHSAPASACMPWFDRAYQPAHFSTVRREDCLVITVLRNPFDMLVSMYTYGFPYWSPRFSSMHRCIDWPFKSFRDFIHKLCKWDEYPWIVPPQKNSLFFQLFSDEGEFLPDFVLRQESIEGDLSKLGEHLGLNIEIPPTKINSSRENIHYSAFYDDELFELVCRRYAGDLGAFGYGFEGYEPRTIADFKRLRFDHKSGRYHDAPPPPPLIRSGGGECLADKDLHPWGSGVLSHFTGRELASDLGRRLLRRLGFEEK